MVLNFVDFMVPSKREYFPAPKYCEFHQCKIWKAAVFVLVHIIIPTQNMSSFSPKPMSSQDLIATKSLIFSVVSFPTVTQNWDVSAFNTFARGTATLISRKSASRLRTTGLM